MKLATLGTLSLLTTGLWAQQVTDTRNASIRGGGGEGKCTIEVEVDGIADVEIQGSQGRIRTLSGGAANFRRFECNQAMPMNPANFRFQGIDGRGRQTLVSNPDGRRGAVIRLEDSKGGREGYTFDIFWNGNGGGGNFGGGNRGNNDNDGWDNNGRGNNRWANGGWGNSNGNGWSNDWDDQIRFQGRGDGTFRGVQGRRYNLNDCVATIDRRGGDVTLFFDTSSNHDLRFNGRIERIDRGVIYARMDGVGVNGLMEIRLQNRNRIQSVNLQSGNGRRGAELRWRQ
jgi:hypothetical protein